MENKDLTKMEFVLSLGKNIIIQRFFNVKNFNPNSKYSLELYNEVTYICENIAKGLKMRTLEYLDDNKNYYFDEENVPVREEKTEEYFILQIKKENDIFIERIFPAHVYHPKVRHTVDIRSSIREVLNGLTWTLSNKNITTQYLKHSLLV